MTPRAVLCTGLAATQPQAHHVGGGFAGSRPCSWVPRRPRMGRAPHPHTAGRLRALAVFLRGTSASLGRGAFARLPCCLPCRAPRPLSISLKARAVARSHCLSRDGVFWPVSPRHALLTPFSGASMTCLLRSHCSVRLGQGAGSRWPSAPAPVALTSTTPWGLRTGPEPRSPGP